MKKIISILMALVFAMSMVTGCAAAENTTEDFVLTMQVGNPVMTVNGTEQEIDPGSGTVHVVINDRTLIPIRAIIEAMGGTVGWEQETQTVTITKTYAISSAPAVTSSADTKDSKVLVAYFSMPDNVDDSAVAINGQVLGNNQYFAQITQKETVADVFRIEAQTQYPADHETLVDIASEEQKDNARPAIKDTIAKFDDYDVIFVGYPIWWRDMPMIMYTFFDTYNFLGKTIIPFDTHGGSSWAGTPDAIAELEHDAEIIDGLSISRDNIEEARGQISEWIKNVLPVS